MENKHSLLKMKGTFPQLKCLEKQHLYISDSFKIYLKLICTVACGVVYSMSQYRYQRSVKHFENEYISPVPCLFLSVAGFMFTSQYLSMKSS